MKKITKKNKSIKISDKALRFKDEIQKLFGITIKIKDRKEHKNWKLKTTAFCEGTTVYVDPSQDTDKLNEQIFHELAHIYLSYDNYPKYFAKVKLTSMENVVLDKLVSLVEDIAVDALLERKNLPFDKYDPKSEYNRFLDIEKSNKYLSFGKNKEVPDEIKLLHACLAFIKLMLEGSWTDTEISNIEKIAIKNLGNDNWIFIEKISNRLKDIFNSSLDMKNKIKESASFLLKEFDLKDKIDITSN